MADLSAKSVNDALANFVAHVYRTLDGDAITGFAVSLSPDAFQYLVVGARMPSQTTHLHE